MALPAGWLAAKLGYKGGIIAGLLLVAVGGFWFVPATHIGSFWAFLLGVCIIAAGLTFLETIANPYATVLGPEEYGATRINLAQSCNGIGLIFGPIAGGMFFYSKNAAGASTGSETLWVPYAGVAVVVIILAIIFYFANVPDIKAKDDFHMDDSTPGVSHSIWSHQHFVMAVVAQFLYVAAQAGIFSFFINYMTSQVPEIPPSLDAAVQNGPDFFKHWINSLTEIRTTGAIAFNNKGASNLVSVGLLLFLGGRFIGTALLRKFAADKLLGLYGAINMVLCLLIFLKLGWFSGVCVFGTYFFMSIMFPTIFALSIHGLGEHTKVGSSILIMSIVGGAIMTPVMGRIVDIGGMRVGFIIPLICFSFIAAYAVNWVKLEATDAKAPGTAKVLAKN
jgi:FHS family L-fucose permease-like MFS transporter